MSQTLQYIHEEKIFFAVFLLHQEMEQKHILICKSCTDVSVCVC